MDSMMPVLYYVDMLYYDYNYSELLQLFRIDAANPLKPQNDLTLIMKKVNM